MTPEGKPFYGGTYFPPRPVYNRNSWREVLAGVSNAFRDRRTEVEQQAENLTRHVATLGSFDIGADKEEAGNGKHAGAGNIFQPATLQQATDQLMAAADKEEGGFGAAPKFPQTFSIRFLLNQYYFTQDKSALDQACLSLDKMVRGGIYDQLGGGFARYSTDREWLVPHFEKMLYDNALLIITLSEAYQMTRKPLYREAIEQTIDFIDRELGNKENGYYSSLDADSEGIEGKYYVWDKAEIEGILGETAPLFCEIYGVTEEGNWEEKNILTRRDRSLSADEKQQLAEARRRLLQHRSRRVAPALDDKVLLGWNALMNLACSKAFAALGDERYREMAVANMRFLRGKMKGEGGLHSYYHSYKGGARYPAFLDDYANLIAALIGLQEVTGDGEYLLEAKAVAAMVVRHFGDPESGFFLYTHDGQSDVVVRKKEIYDGATPSGNSMMAFNLLYLSVIFDEPGWGERARSMALELQRPVVTYPGSFGIWATLFQAFTYTIPEVVITGEQPEKARKEFLSHLIPYRVFQSADRKDTQFPLLRDKPIEKLTLIFLCKNYTCQLPVNEVATAVRNLENVYKFKH